MTEQTVERILLSLAIIVGTMLACYGSYRQGILDERLRLYKEAQCTCTITEPDKVTKHVFQGSLEDDKEKQHYAEN